MNKNNFSEKKYNQYIKMVSILNPITKRLISVKTLSKRLRDGLYNKNQIKLIQERLQINNLGFNSKTGRITKANNRALKKQIKKEKQQQKAVSKIEKFILQKKQEKKLKDEFTSKSLTITYPQGDENLLEMELIYQIVRDNNLQGQYRILVFDDITGQTVIDWNGDILNAKSKWYKENRTQFQYDSEFMLYNHEVSDFETPVRPKTFIFTKLTEILPQTIQQKFLDGINHCFFTPILQWAEEKFKSSKTKNAQKNYTEIINKIQGKKLKENKYYKSDKCIGYIEKYKDGIPENHIQSVADDLRISLEITQPFNSNPLIEIQSQNKARKKFKFVNTRLNHIEKNENKYTLDTIHNNDLKNAVIVDRDEINKIYKNLLDNDIDFIYKKDIYGISSIKSFNDIWKIDDDYKETIIEFEKETGLCDCSIDAIKYPELSNYIYRGTHFNGTVDFIHIDNSNRKTLAKDDKIKHIDMPKAYTIFKKTKYYNGFLGKITDFRKVDNYNQKGLYYITDLDLTNCNKHFRKLISKLGWFCNDNIYCDTELKLLNDYGGKFLVKYGAYGLNMDFEFNDDMKNKKDVIKVDIDGNDCKVPYYSKYTGMISMMNSKQNFYMTNKKKLNEYLSIMKNSNEDLDIFYDDMSNEATIQFNKKYIYHKRHIASQILSYQRIILLEQLLNMDYNKLVRVCVDGIYFKDHNCKLNETFLYKTKKTFNNSETDLYLSQIFNEYDFETEICNTTKFLPTAEPRDFYKTELFLGGGGCGKTHRNLIDGGLINVCFVAPSWKLSSKKKEEFSHISSSVLHRFTHEPYSMELINKYNVLIIDEGSMINELEKQFIMKNSKSKLIFCGDLGFQLPPVISNDDKKFIMKNNLSMDLLNEMNTEGFENIEECKTNFRSGNDKQLMKIINYLRDVIKLEKQPPLHYVYNQIKNKFKSITKDELKKIYNKKDLIICSENVLKDEYTEIFKDIQKYKVIENSRDFKNGTIVYEKVDKVKMDLQHGYTIHSIQGETATTKLFIDMKKQKSIRMLYTAISRAKELNQIYFIN